MTHKLLYFVLGFICLNGASAYSFDSEFYKKIEQPINFSHKTHAKIDKIPCEYCHSNARRSQNAGIPPVRTCIGCHAVIKGTSEEQKQEIEKVMSYWETKTPIPWKKLNDLPDFVYFSHQKHVKKGLDCTQCHGEVSETTQPVPDYHPQINEPSYSKEIPLSMGFCVECHRSDLPVDKEGKIIQQIARKTRGGEKIDKPIPHKADVINGPIDCLVCHK